MACPRDFACHLCVADCRALRPGSYPSSIEQKKGRVLPGQRAGSLLWNEDITNHLKETLDMVECTIYPSMLKAKDNKLFILLHVDDFLVTGHVDMVEKRLIPALKGAYKISYSIMRQMGEELTFLKRRHVLLSDELMLIKPHHKHIAHLKEIMAVHPKAYPKKTPSHPAIDDEDNIALLSDSEMSKYRSAVGILLYLAADLPHCQHCIRFLTTKMTSATQHCWQVLKHLVLYLAGNQDVCLSLNFKGQQRGVFHDYTSVEDAMVEVYTDADWASSKDDRRSISSCAIFYGGCLLHASSRTQKIVSLSSAESEMYAAASGACDAVLIVGILSWMFDSFFQICLYLDSAAARGIINRRGVGKVRHLSCRSLWLQGRMADGSMIVSPVSGLKNPADIGAKRLNVQRMKALMFLLGMFDSFNNCQVGEVEARSILQHQELKQAMSSLRRLMKSDVESSGALQLVMFMNALSLARGDDGMTTVSIHGAGWRWWPTYMLQIVTLVACMIAGMVFLARSWVRRRDQVAHDQDLLEGQVPFVDEADDDVGETSSDRWYRYKNCSMSECSDPEYWMELKHIELKSSEAESVDAGPNPVRDRLMEVLEGDYISNRAIASWLFSRVNRRLENATDEADRVIFTEMHYALSVGLINMTNGNLRPSFEQVRGIVLGQSNISYDADSPSASLSVAQMREEIIQSEVHATEHYNGDGSLHHVSYTLVSDLMANSEPVDEAGPLAMEVDQEGPMFGPQTHYDAMLDDIHERRARALEELNGRLQIAYNHGPQELVWELQAQIDWWLNVI